MSRIGKKPVAVLDGVKVAVEDSMIRVEGPKGKLQFAHRPEVQVAVAEDGKSVSVSRSDDERMSRSLHGLTRALINNMIFGVKNGYEKRLEVVGVGYLCNIKGKCSTFASVSLTNFTSIFPTTWKSLVPTRRTSWSKVATSKRSVSLPPRSER